MKRMFIFLLTIALPFVFLVACGPSAMKLEEKRLQDSIQVSVNHSAIEDVPELKVIYYKDETTGIVFAVMQACGETKIEIVPANQMGVTLNNCKNKIKSNY